METVFKFTITISVHSFGTKHLLGPVYKFMKHPV